MSDHKIIMLDSLGSTMTQRNLDGDPSRPQPSRRAVVAATSTAIWAAVPAPTESAAPDETTKACLEWVAVDSEIRRLLAEWGRIEAYLVRTVPGFLQIPAEEVRNVPGGGRRMAEIEQQLEALYDAHQRLLPALPALKGRTASAVIAKLIVAARLVHPDEHPEAHRTIADSVRDLRRLLHLG